MSEVELCALLQRAAALPRKSDGSRPSLFLAADPGAMTGVPEVKHLLYNTALEPNGSVSSMTCPSVAVGTLLGQPVVLATTGIGEADAAMCTSELLQCGVEYREAVWMGTSGWSLQLGGVLNADDCSEANQSPEVVRLGDLCVSPLAGGWCFKDDGSGLHNLQASSTPINLCFSPPLSNGPGDNFLFGQCTFTKPGEASIELSLELQAAARVAAYQPRPAGLEEYEQLLWETMSNGTGVEYNYRPQDSPTVFDHTQCAEISGDNFRAGYPNDAQAREFVADLITHSGLANATSRDVLAASAMEARGFLSAVYRFNAAPSTQRQLPYTIIRGASDHDSNTVERDPEVPGVWWEGDQVTEDAAAGYSFAIGTVSTAVLSMLKLRCQQGGGARSCDFSLPP